MPQLSFVTLDVFTRERYAGNPLAVVRVPLGREVSTEQMQRIAREFNLSETIFLHDRDDDSRTGDDAVHEWRVRIFLTKAEIPFAGHPTIGCAVYALSSLVTGDVRRGRFIANAGPIELDFADGVARAAIPHNFHRHTQYPFTLEDVYHLQPALHGTLTNEPASITGTEVVNIVSPVRGMNFVLVELPDLASLGSITSSRKPSPRLDNDWNTGFSGSLFYVLTAQKSDTIHIRARMIEGLLEDPATGSAACGLTCFLALHAIDKRVTTHFDITQGVEMGRESHIGVTVNLNESCDAVSRVELSGSAVKVMEGVVEY